METLQRPDQEAPLKGVRSNIVQSIRAFRVSDLQDALEDGMTDPLHTSGPQPGFVVVLEQIPTNPKFDKEAREQLLDIFRDTADYWHDRKIPFRCFYSFL